MFQVGCVLHLNKNETLKVLLVNIEKYIESVISYTTLMCLVSACIVELTVSYKNRDYVDSIQGLFKFLLVWDVTL